MILMYHKVYPEAPTPWWVDVDNFYRQMLEIRRRKVVYLDDYDPEDPDNVAITFDGVYQDVLKFAVPILNGFSYPFELFVTSGYIGRDNSFDAPEPPARFADMDALREMARLGGRIQWHTKTHKNLKDVQEPSVIEDELGVPEEIRALDPKGFRWFAYPHGEFSEHLVLETRRRFKGAVSCVQGDDRDPYRLNRVTVTNGTSFKAASIGVIIPSYNYGGYLVEAVESVLRQTRPVDEILISDDSSSDNTYEIACEYQRRHPGLIKVNKNGANLGVSEHFRKAVSMTGSDYICILGADNRLRSDFIEKTAQVLDSDPTAAVSYTDFALFGERASEVYSKFPEEWRAGVKEGYYYLVRFPEFTEESKARLQQSNFIHGSSLYRRKAYDEAGGYAGRDGAPEDHGLFLRMIKAGWSARKADGYLLEYRQHSREQANVRCSSYAELDFYRSLVGGLTAENSRMKQELDYLRTGRGSLSNAWKKFLRRILCQGRSCL